MLYAHYNHELNDKQTLDAHLYNVSHEMKKGLETVSFSDITMTPEMMLNVGLYHDSGKMTKWFQEYLVNMNTTYGKKKNHSFLSAVMLFLNQFDGIYDESLLLALITIICHHKNLSSERPTEESFDYIEEQLADCEYQSRKMKTIAYVKKTDDIYNSFSKFWRRSLKKVCQNKNPEYFFTLQFLFSKLISSDKRDSARLLDYNLTSIRGDVDKYLSLHCGGGKCLINDDRSNIRNIVLQNIRDLTDKELLDRRIFTLTAPTGTGKTLTSVSAAILLKERLGQIYDTDFHIITVIPFLNILEQTITVYEEIFQDVMVDASCCDPTDISEDGNMSLSNKLLLKNTWMSSVILTTFVKFFESIITSNQTNILKVSRLTNAIVIMDEIQSLDAERYPLYAVTLDMISKCYGCRFILMTATQPKLFEYTDIYNYQCMPRIELLNNYEYYFKKLKRTALINLVEQITDFNQLIDYIYENNIQDKNILIVVNTIKDSINLYKMLIDEGFDCLYLSTNITGKDRKKVINIAKKRLLREKDSFVMVSTQTIEAGVDLDFDIAFRDMAPLESIIQTAGRVNRSGMKGEYLPVYIFNTQSAEKIYSYMSINETKKRLNLPIIKESDYQPMIEQYYNNLSRNNLVSFDRKIYEEGILKLDYSVIDEFKMIKDGDRCSIIFLQDEEIITIVEEICQIILCDDKGYLRKIKLQKLLNRLNQYTVDVFVNKLKENMPISFGDYSKAICGKRIELKYLIVPYDDMERFYNETGFISESEGVYFY